MLVWCLRGKAPNCEPLKLQYTWLLLGEVRGLAQVFRKKAHRRMPILPNFKTYFRV